MPPKGMDENLLRSPENHGGPNVNNEDVIHIISELNREIRGLRESSLLTQRAVSQLQVDLVNLRCEQQAPDKDEKIRREY